MLIDYDVDVYHNYSEMELFKAVNTLEKTTSECMKFFPEPEIEPGSDDE